MDLRQLKYFIAVAEERHLGRAATRLHLTQPPLTRQIRALEAEVGAQLFVRTPRGVELTQAGEALLRDARNIGTLVDQARVRAQRAGQGRVGRLDIGLYGTAMYEMLPRLLAGFRAAHPDVELTLHHGRMPEQLVALRQRRVELVFERMVPREDDVAVELVASEPVLLALPQHHPLAAHATVAVDALRDEPWIMSAAPRSQLEDVGLALCREQGFEPRVADRVADVVTGLLLVAAGLGVQPVPASARVLQMPGIVYRPLAGPTRQRMDMFCYWLRGERSPLLEVMLDTVRDFRLQEQRSLQAVQPGPGGTGR